MEADNRYEIQGKNWRPRFTDPEVEQRFLSIFNTETLPVARIGLWIVLVVWIGFGWLDLRLAPAARTNALLFRLAVAAPLMAAILAATYWRHAPRFYQFLAVSALFIIEGSVCTVVTFYDFPTIIRSFDLPIPLSDADGKFIFVMVWLVIIFMGTGVLRLSAVPAMVAGLIFVAFNFLTFVIYRPAAIIALIVVPFLLAVLPVVWFGSLYVQRYAREEYRFGKLLDDSLQRSEQLLLNILPEPIAARLKQRKGTIADGFDSVSVLFADIVDFTEWSQRYRAEEIVQLLNRIFSAFDHIAQKHGVEKIKTIGDAYMGAAGVPETSPKHCVAVADCALEMVAAVRDFKGPDGRPVEIRVGIHTGPAIAGVIGAHKFAYDLWGDTVNTASRMESNGAAGKIQATEEIYAALKDDFVFEAREAIEIKGKGRLNTWWLTGRRVMKQ